MDFASYYLWSQFEPALGWEDTHCQMQRGWRSTLGAKPLESISSPLAATIWQKVGKLAQQGVSEFHRDPLLLKHPRGSERVADRLYLYYELAAVRDRVLPILRQYQAQPWLLEQEILLLNRGDEPLPPPIEIRVGDYSFELFAAFDCVVREVVPMAESTTAQRDRIHIIDFKTGLADFDRRQADVYLLAGSYLYPDCEIVASFYNLETLTSSELITATPARLAQIAQKLAQIAQLHQQQLQEYRRDPDCFDRLFPPHPGTHCRACSFNYRCGYAMGC
ncbi:PD-(D/E)XK nuclease family protein [Chamaesiphon sp. VAR_69_metabat_338]|uniref:PD-(D/E)XK nuclease family protein n=1 Tax=Chamaesiphon sp. VAR_69_metabat_338 TaxID=2964704 RepID=UPI00286DA629|nr:PD-(D/E)XK nuclease family protein [Chamaesiphon sp. VAR_69_metabat_338]